MQQSLFFKITGKNLLKIVTLLVWLGACYVLRFQLMEDPRWVNTCDGDAALLACQTRKLLGLVVHFQVLAWCALTLAVLAALIKTNIGARLAWIALFFAVPALALYTATLAAFALVIAALRVTRPASPAL